MVECPICLRDVTLSENARPGDIIQCPYLQGLVQAGVSR